MPVYTLSISKRREGNQSTGYTVGTEREIFSTRRSDENRGDITTSIHLHFIISKCIAIVPLSRRRHFPSGGTMFKEIIHHFAERTLPATVFRFNSIPADISIHWTQIPGLGPEFNLAKRGRSDRLTVGNHKTG